jgi:hypothetical protein
VRFRRYTVRKYEYYINLMASRIQLWFRLRRLSILGRAFREQLKTCATKIQACVAGHLARKYTHQLRRHKMATRLQVCCVHNFVKNTALAPLVSGECSFRKFEAVMETY